MTHDAGVHDDAQRYLLLGLRAAYQAGSDGTGIGGHLLNCLARQANHLGYAHDALDLVQAAQYGTRKLPPGGQTEAADTATTTALALMGEVHSTRVSDRLRELDTELAAAPADTATADSRGRIRAALRPS
ncbi:hypothetical protein [Streptomyces sp. NPDC047097]|uniref:hypothetical protein n=1 Tax=Streptomyces sp. NPDC047097 TaxID=3155260 RepID=UPI0034043DF3